MSETDPAIESSEPPQRELAAVAEQLDRVAVLVIWTFPILGLIVGTIRLLEAVDHPDLGPMRWVLAGLGSVYLFGAYALGGVILAALLRLLGKCCLVHQLSSVGAGPVRQGEAATAPAPTAGPALPALELLKERTVAEIHHVIRERKWEEASALLEAFGLDHPGDPRIAAVQSELSSARDAARADLLATLEAARQVNDPDRVLELHHDLVPLLDVDARYALETDLARWCLRLIHNRLRGAIIQPDVAALAGRVAEVFSHTKEGASLRVSLPTLRRSAGLCPRCAQPYKGIADACPDCLGPAHAELKPPVPQSS
jgi:hypothetical protein